jgi:chitinase
MAALVAAVRAKYPEFLITYTIQSGTVGTTKIKGVGIAFWSSLKSSNSIIQLMNYDFFGSWEKKTMLGSGLNYADPAIAALNSMGISNDRIILGKPMYATQASSVVGPGLGVSYSTRSGTPQIPYSQIVSKTLTVTDVISESENSYFLGSYANDASKHFFTFDSQPSVRGKAQYTLAKGLAGVMFWELTQDTLDDTSLLKAAADVLQGAPNP